MSYGGLIHPLLWLAMSLLVATDACPNATLIAPCDCNDDPSTIECVEKNLTALPLHIPEPFDEFWFEGNNLPTVTTVPYSSIRFLKMEYNHIETIQPGAFKKLTNLTKLILANNLITLNNAKEFEGLKSLQFLNIESNNIGELKDGAFTGQYLLNIMDIKLENCRITKVDVSAFNNLPTLRKLDLSNNRISTAPVFQQQNNLMILRELDLSHNRLTALRNDTFHDLPALSKLDLSHNRIRVVTSTVFHAVQTTLTSLDFSYNKLGPEMSFALQHMLKLKSIDISSNNISTLYPESLNWDPLEQLLITDNPWHCRCGSEWIIREELIRETNDISNVKCNNPEELAGKSVFDIDPKHVKCTGPGGSGIADALGVSIACIISILIIIGVAYFLYRRTEKWRLKRRGHLIPSVSSQYTRVKDDQRAQLVM